MKVAFIGHRNIEQTQKLREQEARIVETLIINENAEIFLFGSKSAFDKLCYEVVTKLREKYEDIRRIFVRAEYEFIGKDYREYLLSLYEDTYFPTDVHGAGALSYIKRNKSMIDKCDVLITYCNKDYMPRKSTGSGTRIAVNYALSKKKRIINLFEPSANSLG